MVSKELERKYSFLSHLTAKELAAIDDLSAGEFTVERGGTLFTEDGDKTRSVFILREGRVCAARYLQNGRRAITRLYFPGDIVGTANVPFDTAPFDALVLEKATVQRVPRDRLTDMFLNEPRLSAMFFTFAALESAILNDRLTTIGRTSGLERLASLLMEVASRLQIMETGNMRSFNLGMNQSDLGDAIGMTNVHVNRLMQELRGLGIVSYDQQNISIIDAEKLAGIGRFTNRYAHVDTSWLPEGERLAA